MLTPEERAEKVYRGLSTGTPFDVAVEYIADAIRDAVDAERERCAAVADAIVYTGRGWPGLHREGMSDAALKIAAAIREGPGC